MKYQGKVNGQNMQTFGEEAKGKDVETLEGIFWQNRFWKRRMARIGKLEIKLIALIQ